MSQPVLLKVYGNIAPAPVGLAATLAKTALAALPPAQDPVISQVGELITISFEGIYFPLEETVAAILGSLKGNEKGKVDALDIEEWILTRYLIAAGQISKQKAPLNHVLAWSGH